jgi:hypothetical protein
LNIETLKEEWKRDSAIDETNLNRELVRIPLLHSKYLEYLMLYRAKKANAIRKLNTMKNVKRRYYRGEFTREDLEEHGWHQWQGLKPSASELNMLFEIDSDLNDLEERVEYWNTALLSAEYIMRLIHSRGYDLKTMVEFTKFQAGA